MKYRTAFIVQFLAAISAPALAQTLDEAENSAAQEDLREDDSDAIVVTGQRMRGEVLGDIPPEVTLDAGDVRAVGAGSLAELLDALAPQTQSERGGGGGRPVILLNGRRFSGFSEIRDLPNEAVERVDILPEEVALRYGYPAEQRVVNFVLRENFRAVTAELEFGMPTAGGRESYEADVNYLALSGPSRFSFDVEAERDTFLFESERDLLQTMPENIADADAPLVARLGDFRALLPLSDRVEVNSTYNRAVSETITGSVNARLSLAETESRFGLPFVDLALSGAVPLRRFSAAPGPLTRDSETATGHVGLALNGDLLPWRWSLTGNWDRVRSESRTDAGLDPAPLQERIDQGDPAFDPFASLPPELLVLRPRDFALSISESADAKALLTGPLAALPAGDLTASFKAGAAIRSLASQAIRSGDASEVRLSRHQVDGQASFDLPIASTREGFLDRIGDLSANLNLALRELSDFGTLTTLGYGFNWRRSKISASSPRPPTRKARRPCSSLARPRSSRPRCACSTSPPARRWTSAGSRGAVRTSSPTTGASSNSASPGVRCGATAISP